MTCVFQVNAGFAFAVLSELLLFPLLILFVLSLYDKFPRHILSYIVVISCPLLFFFSIVSLATYGSCFSSDFVSTILSRGSYALSTGVRSILFSIFLLVVILLNKFLFQNDLFPTPSVSHAQHDDKTAPYTATDFSAAQTTLPVPPPLPGSPPPPPGGSPAPAPAFPAMQHTSAAEPAVPVQPVVDQATDLKH